MARQRCTVAGAMLWIVSTFHCTFKRTHTLQSSWFSFQSRSSRSLSSAAILRHLGTLAGIFHCTFECTSHLYPFGARQIPSPFSISNFPVSYKYVRVYICMYIQTYLLCRCRRNTSSTESRPHGTCNTCRNRPTSTLARTFPCTAARTCKCTYPSPQSLQHIQFRSRHFGRFTYGRLYVSMYLWGWFSWWIQVDFRYVYKYYCLYSCRKKGGGLSGEYLGSAEN